MRQESLNERLADGAIHLAGVLFGLTAASWLIHHVFQSASAGLKISIVIYCAGLLAMFILSAFHNVLGCDRSDNLLRRLDHAAIFIMIAGSYTPFAVMILDGFAGVVLLVLVWAGALAGAGAKIAGIERIDRYTVQLCILLGSAGGLTLQPLLSGMSIDGAVLLLSGGALYTIGALFHVWRSLPFQNAIWHGFVLSAAVCHFMVISGDIAHASLI